VACRAMFAYFWLMMLLPGNPVASRNPVGSLADRSHHLLTRLDQAS
jgi:hypothetical protein